MNALLEQLHDIEGLDSISIWPLAMGWWVLIGVGIVLLVLFGWLLARKLAFIRSWKNDTFRKLAVLENNLSEATSAKTLVLLSEYLRRICLKQFSRKECAGLTGTAWLKWLSQRDPKNFDWEKQGMLLIEAPYAPADHTVPVEQVKELITATRHWVY
jgi:Domain of unknown function (DUF4381)